MQEIKFSKIPILWLTAVKKLPMSISKNNIKLINSLRQKKYRQQHGLFVAEGVKVVNELLNSSLKVESIYSTNDFSIGFSEKVIQVSEVELKKISSLKSPNKVLVKYFAFFLTHES